MPTLETLIKDHPRDQDEAIRVIAISIRMIDHDAAIRLIRVPRNAQQWGDATAATVRWADLGGEGQLRIKRELVQAKCPESRWPPSRARGRGARR